MRKRFFRAAVISIAAGLLIAFLFAVPLMEQIYTDEAEDTLSNVLALADAYLEEGADYQQAALTMGERLESAGSELRLTIIAADGKVLGDSREDPASMENHRERREVAGALEQGEGRDIRKSATLGLRQMYLARSRTLPDGRVVVLRASVPLKGFGQVQFMLWCCAGIGIFLGLIVALFSAHYAAGRMMEPVHSLVNAVRRAVREIGGSRTYITSQNHGYAVVSDSVKAGQIRFVNANDGTCEGIDYPEWNAFTVQFHPEACSGPKDTSFLFDRFMSMMGGESSCR